MLACVFYSRPPLSTLHAKKDPAVHTQESRKIFYFGQENQTISRIPQSGRFFRPVGKLGGTLYSVVL